MPFTSLSSILRENVGPKPFCWAELPCFEFSSFNFLLLGQIPSTGAGALTHHYTHIPTFRRILHTHPKQLVVIQTCQRWWHRPRLLPSPSSRTTMPNLPVRAFETLPKRTMWASKKKKKKGKKYECNVVVQNLQKWTSYPNNYVAFNSITPTSSRSPHTPSSFFFGFSPGIYN